MPNTRSPRFSRRKRTSASFTLVEMLTAMAIIGILAALVIYAARGVWKKSMRSRAATEIQGLSSALDAFKVENGVYPNTNINTAIGMPNGLVTNSVATPYFYTSLDGTSTPYIQNAQTLYTSLSGQITFADTTIYATNKAYYYFKRSQVGDAASGGSYVKDPWNFPYGYSTGTGDGGTTTNYPYNGNGFYDLWSTGGTYIGGGSPETQPNVNSWISNWQH